MKMNRLFSIAMAVVLLVTAMVPFAVTPAAALQNESVSMITSTSYGCSLVTQTPADWTYMSRRQSFDTYWTVRNTGSVWHSNTVFKWISGTKLQTGVSSFAIGKEVGLGSKIKLGIDMVAPRYPGTYSTTWALYAGNTRVCRVYVIITVR